jgi:hypothetical protein
MGVGQGHTMVCWDTKLKMGVCIRSAMGSPLVQGHVLNVWPRKKLLRWQESSTREGVILGGIWSRSHSLTISAVPGWINPSWPRLLNVDVAKLSVATISQPYLNPSLVDILGSIMVGDYMSMPLGKGGFHTVGLFMDVYSQKIFGFKFTTYGSTTMTITSLNRIQQMYRMPKVFIADGGSHFAGAAVGEWCIEDNSWYQQVAAYSQWVNGLLEGTNGKLLSRLKRLCVPNLGEDAWAKITKFEDLPRVWLDHFDTAIEQLNGCILPAYKFSPNELCLGTVVNTSETPVAISSEELSEASVTI